MSNGANTRIERSRAKIIAAAADVFLDQGFLGATMDQIAAQAKVSVQTIYSHFQSKETLFHEVVGSLAGGAARNVGREVERLPDGTGPEEWLLRFANEQLKAVLKPRLMQLRRMVIGESGRFPELGAALYREGPGRAIDRLSQALDHFASEGTLSVTDSRVAAKQFNWLLMGGPTSEAMHLGDSAIPGPRQMKKHACETVDLFLVKYAVTKDDPEKRPLMR
ncbi:TetR family transcriptional regulator [Mesorhizobium sp. NBSH29]|uniref:TetR/AcrR family transcriptional regulator n=1 Tax=Mesorhizobium sp. NBSH29 TaxID=2654249 RepID=UPI0018965C4A|nr:TetR/AcrR family transcriptional regulator [Mesorhizobium sp. NBSH29]QPC86397.1 TetR family transcriptional regulator [Mesorhizobium sp. NBSH29]